MIRRPRFDTLRLATATCLVAAIGCNKQTQLPEATSQPAAGPASQPAPSPAPTAAPSPAQETRPAESQPEQPASTYDPKPPYPVKLYVHSPEDRQPGWLKILELVDDTQPASATGVFPEKNRIYVDTVNVRRLQIHVGQLPLAAGKRRVLRIDEQGIELARKRREFTLLERSPAGIWTVVSSD